MLQAALLIAPIAGAAYLSMPPKSDSAVARNTDDMSSGSSISKNIWVYLEDPLPMPRVIPGDHYEFSPTNPQGSVQAAMAAEENPTRALAILGAHESAKDKTVQSLWTEFVKPKVEIQTRSVDQLITTVNFAKPGTWVDEKVTTGNRFWDQPVPRSTGIDRYYKRRQTVPWYLVP